MELEAAEPRRAPPGSKRPVRSLPWPDDDPRHLAVVSFLRGDPKGDALVAMMQQRLPPVEAATKDLAAFKLSYKRASDAIEEEKTVTGKSPLRPKIKKIKRRDPKNPVSVAWEVVSATAGMSEDSIWAKIQERFPSTRRKLNTLK